MCCSGDFFHREFRLIAVGCVTFMLHSKEERCCQQKTLSCRRLFLGFWKQVVIGSVTHAATPHWELLVVLESLSVEPFKPNLPPAILLRISKSVKRLRDLCALLVRHPNRSRATLFFSHPPHWGETHATVPCLLGSKCRFAHWVCEGISQANVLAVCHSLLHKYEVPNCHTWWGGTQAWMCLHHIDGNSSGPCSHVSLIPSQALVKHCSVCLLPIEPWASSHTKTFSHHSGFVIFSTPASYLEGIGVDET